MITWRLWLRLRYPPTEHPLFKRKVQMINQVTPPWYMLLLLIIAAPVIVIPGLALAGTTYSLLWTTSIASNISREYDARRYDQYALLPDGELGINWLMATACLHRNTAFVRVHSLGMWMIRAITLFLVASSGLTAYFDMTDSAGQIRAGITFTVCMLILVADNYQSIVSAALLGMIISALIRDRFSVVSLAFSAQAGLLMAVYLVLLVISLLIVPSAADAALDPIRFSVILTVLMVGFVLLREVINYGLWRVTRTIFKTNLSDEPIMLDWPSPPLI